MWMFPSAAMQLLMLFLIPWCSVLQGTDSFIFPHSGSSWGESSSGRITNWLVLKNLTPQVRLEHTDRHGMGGVGR